MCCTSTKKSLQKKKQIQRKSEESGENAEGERKNIRRPTSEKVGEEPGTSWTIHTQHTLSVCITNHTGMRVQKRGVQQRAAAATAGSAIISKSNTGDGRKEQAWEKEDASCGRIGGEIPVITETNWEHEERRKGVQITGRGLRAKQAGSFLVLCGNTLGYEGANSRQYLLNVLLKLQSLYQSDPRTNKWCTQKTSASFILSLVSVLPAIGFRYAGTDQA